MKLVALVGTSGTGKSYKAMSLAREYHIDYLIDDGILIHNQKKLIGSSAKREKTRVAAVKRAIFFWEEPCAEMSQMIKEENPNKLLIIGTSIKMVKTIARNLKIEPIDEIVMIEDISTSEEIATAKYHRANYGKHVIPLPMLEVRKDFSGYFLDKLKIFSRVFGRNDAVIEKSVVRPTFSQMGHFTISNKTLLQIIGESINRTEGTYKHSKIKVYKKEDRLRLEIDITTIAGVILQEVGKNTIKNIVKNLENMTQMNIINIDLNIINIHFDQK